MQIKNRLTFRFTLIVASILLIFSLSIYFSSSYYRVQRFNKRLTQRGLTVAKLLITVDEVDSTLLRIIEENNLAALEHEKVTIYNELNKRIYNKNQILNLPLDKNLLEKIVINRHVFYSIEEEEAAGLLYTDRKHRFIILISAYDKIGLDNLSDLKIIIFVGYILSIILIFISGWLFSGQALSPISKIISNVKKITASNLNVRLDEGNGKDELADLAITFNEMLKRLEYSFESQKSFVSNASHELRTPLTSIKAQLQVSLLNTRTNEEYKKLLVSVLEDTEKIIELSNRLLNLAQITSDLHALSFEVGRVDELIFSCIANTSKKYPLIKINFDIEELVDEKDLLIEVNEPLLQTAFLNILDNAAKYSNNSPVVVSLSSNESDVSIKVVDTGVGIDNNDLKYIFEPFYRGSNVRNLYGNGIGLSLSQKIILLHKGTLYISSQNSQGTTVVISIPKIRNKELFNQILI